MSRISELLSSPANSMPKPDVPAHPKLEHQASEKILIIQSAHPNCILRALERLHNDPVFANPRYTLLCRNRPEILEFFRNHPMLAAILGHSGARTAWPMLHRLRVEKYDGAVLFFTGEPGHWKIIWFAFLLGIRHKLVFNENNDCFYFTWKATFSLIRRHLRNRPKAASPKQASRMRTALGRLRRLVPRPASQKEREHYPGERILILQTAEPASVLRALDRLQQAPLFTKPRYTLFCRAFPEVLGQFQNHPMLYETRIHTRTHNSWNHMRSLRRANFDAVVLFLTGDPGYWKIKCFAFLLGARHKVIFNENNDCFYFKWKAWFGLLVHRMASRSRVSTHARWSFQGAGFSLVLIKILLFPIRFAWLLIVWLQLRRSAMRASS